MLARGRWSGLEPHGRRGFPWVLASSRTRLPVVALSAACFASQASCGSSPQPLPSCVDVDLGDDLPAVVAGIVTTGMGDDMPPVGDEDLVYLWTSPINAMIEFGVTGPIGSGFAINDGGCDLEARRCAGGGVSGGSNFCPMEPGRRVFVIVGGCSEACRLEIAEEDATCGCQPPRVAGSKCLISREP